MFRQMLGNPTESGCSRHRVSHDTPLVISDLRLMLSSSPMSVRRALRSTLGGLAGLELTADERATVELVLAEVLNNIVEHAYSEDDAGLIEIRAHCDSRGGLFCQVLDDGAAMPKERLPAGNDDWGPSPDRPVPEGGFGWFLIRELAQDLTYARLNSRNCLAFRLPVGRAMLAS